jgi:hypothetical protein
MNNRSDSITPQIIFDELRALRNELSILSGAIRADMASIRREVDAEIEKAHDRADDAHRRIDKYENRIVGYMLGAGAGGATGVTLVAPFVKDVLKALLGP